MKKRKTLATLALASTLLIPTLALVACSNEEDVPPTIETPIEPENPETPETPETPENGNVSVPPTNESPLPPVVTPIVKKAQYIRCTGDSVNLRSGAGTSYSVVGSAKKGEIYAVIAQSGSWYKTYYRGKEVYLSASYATVLSLDKAETKVENVLDEGYKLLGVPYVYGAVRFHDGKGNLLANFNAQKFDCSSLVQYVFYKGANKTLLDVTTRTQVKQGRFVPKSELKRGDCIYFTNESRQYLSGIERVGHVAIYLGDNYILHTASDYARIEKMTATRWSFYIEARRFI